jgi:hypothetical protein
MLIDVQGLHKSHLHVVGFSVNLPESCREIMLKVLSKYRALDLLILN